MKDGILGSRESVLCVECGRYIYENDSYYAIKRNRKVGGGFVHIHTRCYEKLLPKNKKRKR